MARSSTVRWAIISLGQVLFCIYVKAMNEADINVLETTIVTENGGTIELKWIKTEQFLANEHLPIWTTTYSRHHLMKEANIMQELGPFTTYYDLQKSSAIIYLKNWDCIFGVIDVRYSIVCLPLNMLSGHQHTIGESQHVLMLHDFPDHHHKLFDLSKTSSMNQHPHTSHESSNEYKMLIKTFVNRNEPHLPDAPICGIFDHGKMMSIPSTSSGEPLLKMPRLHFDYKEEVITVYPEILILISHEIVSTTKLLSTLVLRFIVGLNAVAMLFAKLKAHGIRIHINMAGIVIDRNGLGFPPALLFERNRPKGQVVLDSVVNFIRHAGDTNDFRRLLFSDDSFDMFLYATTREWAERQETLQDYSNDVFDIRTNRILQKSKSGTEERYLGSIVNYSNGMQFYVNAARAIAHSMNVGNNPPESEVCPDNTECRSIMQTGNQNCPDCLTWSRASINSFKKYLTTMMNRCYLRNLPRSLHRYGFPRRSLIPADQCLCFGYSPNMETTTHLRSDPSKENHVCDRTMQCNSPVNGSSVHHFAYPIDGTPCDENDDDKVCWKSKCMTTLQSIYGKYAALLFSQ